ncbi:peptidase [Vibrio ponticus]|uniref:Peptidase n=1 Tax=Vibrio ponticus TaxID=265668 RepID=A0A3N3DTX8_9VIBR|nr:S8 family serine peptidase [Vibrio ponticus]ROV57892.1 peptidase [Vibrio ponticus]
MKVKNLFFATMLGLFSTLGYAGIKALPDMQDRHIIVFHHEVSQLRSVEIVNEIRKGKGVIKHQYQTALKGLAVTMPLPALQAISKTYPEIAWIEPDLVVFALPKGGKPDRGGSDEESYIDTDNGTEVTPWGVHRLGGTKEPLSDAKAWILDTGIDVNHRDLNVVTKQGEQLLSRSFIEGQSELIDGDGHGTHVAGTVGAKANNLDVVGVAPGAAVVPIKVLSDSGSGSLSGVIAAIDYVAAQASPGDCANLSLGAQGSSLAMDTALKNAATSGVVFSIAAGNSGADIARYTPAQVQYDHVFTIAAVDNRDAPPRWSNYHTSASVSAVGNATFVEYALPGVSVISTKAGGGTVTYSGTSMAAPHFCGLIVSGYNPVAVGKDISTRKKQYGVIPSL